MPRSAGVTASAVIVFIGSALTILTGGLMLLMTAYLRNPSVMATTPPFLHYFIFLDAAAALGFGGWGIATGIGLIKTMPWSRISMIVYAVMLIVFTLPGAAILAFVPLPTTASDANLPAGFSVIMRVGMVLFYGAFAALGGFWLYFFNKRSVKEQFRRGSAAEVPSAPEFGQGIPVGAQPAMARARPLSITIIAWLLLAGCAFAPLCLWFDSVILPGARIPVYFLGFFVFGRTAILILLVWMAIQAVAAVGLLKLREWGRLTTIALQCLGLVNVALMLGVPAQRAKFQLLMDSMMASVEPSMAQPYALTFPMWIGFALSIPIFLLILWLLVTRKKAFMPPAAEPSTQSR
jgi:hypothetical protein